MELKLDSIRFTVHAETLLIVPYGIETHTSPGTFCFSGRLLIVPYGIETRIRW